MKLVDWKPIKWFIGLPMKTRIISAIVAGTLVVGSGIGIGIGVAMNNSAGVNPEPTKIEKIYEEYVVYAKAEGKKPLSYEEWLGTIKGEKGDKGAKGDDGKSAYQIWLGNGNSGTEADFLAWLKGLNDHSFGVWKSFTTDENTHCEQRMFFHICEDCSVIEWKNGSADDHNWAVVTTAPTCKTQGYDTKTCETCGKIEVENYKEKVGHAWATEYAYDNTYHWYACATCTGIKDKAEHTTDETGICTGCNALVGATEGVLYSLDAGGTHAEVIGYEGRATRVRIADTYEGVPVTSIGDWAFYGCEGLTSVVIPDGVTTIGFYAFNGCTSLTSMVIPSSVRTTDEGAFSRSLKSVYITDLAAWCKISFGDKGGNPMVQNLYLNNKLVTELVIPDNVTSIGDGFRYNTSLTRVVIPDSVTSINGSAFYSCDSLTSVVIGNGVTSIGNGAFNDCSSLTNVVIGDGVTSINDYAFCDCSSLTSVVIGDSVTKIGSFAFSNCTSLTSVYYRGTASDWDAISKGSSNFYLNAATRYYYIENAADVPTDGGNYWYYDTDGNIAIWS